MPGAWRARTVSGALALCLAATMGSGATSPAEATDWTRQIAATRSSQLYFEAAMRGADQQLRSLKHAARRAHKKLAKSRRNLTQARLHHAEVEARRALVLADLAAARATLEAGTGVPAMLTDEQAAGAILGIPSALDLAAPDGTGAVGEPGLLGQGPDLEAAEGATAPLDDGAPGVDAAAAAPSGSGSVAAIAGAWTAETLTALSLAERLAPRIADLEREAEQQRRALGSSRKKLHRVSRSYRAKTRQVAIIKRSARAAGARREGAEASLQYAITAMSSLAQRRAAKKTDVRPGRDSAFVWPTQGRITQTYGCTGFYLEPPSGSCAHFHDGIDIAGYEGTPIRAAAVGIVSYIGWNPWDQRQRAFMVVVAHPGGYETLYAHALPTRNVRVGQLVRKGQLIAYMGSTGRATGVHLHLELRRHRTTLNPLAFL
jgi:murein DD-endopeptidase MepM/ murein hydrolase activator NlpD